MPAERIPTAPTGYNDGTGEYLPEEYDDEELDFGGPDEDDDEDDAGYDDDDEGLPDLEEIPEEDTWRAHKRDLTQNILRAHPEWNREQVLLELCRQLIVSSPAFLDDAQPYAHA